MTNTLINNQEKKQYEFHIDNNIVRVEYIRAQNNIYLTHTEVPRNLEGQGLGSAIIKAALEDVKVNGWTLIPLCPFVASYIKKHPEYRELVFKGINIA